MEQTMPCLCGTKTEQKEKALKDCTSFNFELYESNLQNQINHILDYHIRKFKETNNLYHLLALKDFYDIIQNSTKYTNDQMSDLREEFLINYEDYCGISVSGQLSEARFMIENSIYSSVIKEI